MDRFISSAKESCIYYDQAQISALSLKPKIEALWFKVSVGHLAMRKICYSSALIVLIISYSEGY